MKIIRADEELVLASQRSSNIETLVFAGRKFLEAASDEWFSSSA
jgi:hypothetical protein